MSYHHPDIDRLISLYLSRRVSEREKQELEEWLHISTANREVFEHIKKIWSSPSPDEYSSDMERIRDQIWVAGTGQQQRTNPPVHRKVDGFYWSKVAAVFFIFLLGVGMFSYLIKEKSPTSSPIAVSLIEIKNPAGQRSAYTLPDGTQVWMNAASSLVYPERFVDTMRMVYLKGEAFFEVVKDPQRSFVVEAAGTRTQALGTAFNINAYPEDDTVKIALLEGRVRVQSADQIQTAILSPGEELLAPKDNTAFSRQQFNYISTFGWKEGILIFDGADFASFRSTIEKWYGVKVETKGALPLDWNIRARYQYEDLRHVLRDICFNKNIKFELHDKKVLITF